MFNTRSFMRFFEGKTFLGLYDKRFVTIRFFFQNQILKRNGSAAWHIGCNLRKAAIKYVRGNLVFDTKSFLRPLKMKFCSTKKGFWPSWFRGIVTLCMGDIFVADRVFLTMPLHNDNLRLQTLFIHTQYGKHKSMNENQISRWQKYATCLTGWAMLSRWQLKSHHGIRFFRYFSNTLIKQIGVANAVNGL